MIAYIKGKIISNHNGFLIIENNNIGYKVNVNERTLAKVDKTSYDTKVFTFMNVKEDGVSLYGFLELSELEIFKKLITVSGVGPKGALSLLNTMTPEEISTAIITSDIKALSSGQGIGKKIAQRIAMELKEKVNLSLPIDKEEISQQSYSNNEVKQALEGLISLGFTKTEVNGILNNIDTNNLTADKIISLALRQLSK